MVILQHVVSRYPDMELIRGSIDGGKIKKRPVLQVGQSPAPAAVG